MAGSCTTERFIGQGKVWVATRASNGAINGPWLELGDTELLEVNFTQDFVDDYESCTGNRGIALHVPIQTDVEFTVEPKSFSKENIARITYGDASSVTGAPVVGEIVNVFAAGSPVPVAHPNITSVVVKDGDGAPTLTLTTDYTVDSVNGTITFTTAGLALLTATSNPKTAAIDYTFATHEQVEALTNTIAEYSFRLEGINIVTGLPVLVTCHRVSMNLTETMSFIGVEVNRFPMSGMMLPDPSAGVGASQYMTVVKGL